MRPTPAPPQDPPSADDSELIAEMRQSIESLLQLQLPEELGEALSDGAVLCRVANSLRPRLVPFIHVPSPAAPKLSAANRRRNVESFLDACRRLGVPEAPPAPPRPPPGGCPPPGLLAGFALFYGLLMALLYRAYCAALGC